MRCENYFCIYQENGLCILDDIELDIQGQCKDCTYLDFDEIELQKLKQLKRDKFSFKE